MRKRNHRGAMERRAAVKAIGAIGLGLIVSFFGLDEARAQRGGEAAKSLSPPTGVGTWDLSRDLKKIGQQWAAYDKLLEDKESFNTRWFRVSWWSVGQHIGHVARTMDLLAKQIDEMLANPEKDADLKPNDIVFQVLEGGEIPRGRGHAPESLRLPPKPDPAEVAKELDAAGEGWAKLSTRTQALETVQATYPHFAFGPLTPKRWVRFIAIHNAHHLKIIDDILKEAKAAQ